MTMPAPTATCSPTPCTPSPRAAGWLRQDYQNRAHARARGLPRTAEIFTTLGRREFACR